MYSITLYPGDTATINGADVVADRTVTLRSSAPIERIPTPGLTDLPETDLRSDALWVRDGHRARMTTRQDLRCPCGSAYVRRSASHHSCQHCKRVWENDTVDNAGSQ